MHEVDQPTRAALAVADITRNRVHITETLDDDVWQNVAKTLTVLGGAYQPNRSAWTFTYDVRPAVRQVIETGVCRSAAQAEGFVPTPAALAEELTTAPLSDLARMPAGSRVLEPSAGDGAIVKQILDANDEIDVVAVEPNPQRAAALHELGERVTVEQTTFEEFTARARAGGDLFDAVVMNPPFRTPGRASLWLDHVMLAWNLLEPGGRLVAVVPDTFSFGSARPFRDMRQLVDDFGGWRKLDNGTFPAKTCVIWLARPIPGQEGQPPYVYRHYPDAVEPVPVKYPWLTTRAVAEAPVQVWQDPAWGHRERILRYRAQCWACGWLLWQFDGDNDMALGNHGIHGCLDADEYDKTGLSVGLCFDCGDTRQTREAAEKVAFQLWSKPPTKAAAVSAWSMLLRTGGMLPVDAVERERHARVQAALRIVWGLPEHAGEDELIDARTARPWRGGPDKLAALYLREYADRLDPDGDLDDLDRTALLWREHPDAPPIALAPEPDPWGQVLQLELDLGAPAR